MVYDRLKPLEGRSGRETTAVTKKAVAQMVAHEGVFEGLDVHAEHQPPQPMTSTELPLEAPKDIMTAPVSTGPSRHAGPVPVMVMAPPRPSVPDIEDDLVEEDEPTDDSAPFEAIAPAEDEKPRGLLKRIFRA